MDGIDEGRCTELWLMNNVCMDTFWTLILENCPKCVHNVSKICPNPECVQNVSKTCPNQKNVSKTCPKCVQKFGHIMDTLWTHFVSLSKKQFDPFYETWRQLVTLRWNLVTSCDSRIHLLFTFGEATQVNKSSFSSSFFFFSFSN